MGLGTSGGSRGAERRVPCLEWVELRGECWHPKPEQPAPLARPLPHPGVEGGRASLQGATRLPCLRATLVVWSPPREIGRFPFSIYFSPTSSSIEGCISRAPRAT